MSTSEAVLDQLNRLTPDQQESVLRFARSLQASRRPRGTPTAEVLKFKSSVSSEDLEEMKQAIEEGCEQVNPNAW